jgi:hypothetical protein
MWQKNKSEYLIFNAGYIKVKQKEAFTINYFFPVCNGGVEMKPTNKKHWLMAATAQWYSNRQLHVRLRVGIQPSVSLHQ